MVGAPGHAEDVREVRVPLYAARRLPKRTYKPSYIIVLLLAPWKHVR